METEIKHDIYVDYKLTEEEFREKVEKEEMCGYIPKYEVEFKEKCIYENSISNDGKKEKEMILKYEISESENESNIVLTGSERNVAVYSGKIKNLLEKDN